MKLFRLLLLLWMGVVGMAQELDDAVDLIVLDQDDTPLFEDNFAQPISYAIAPGATELVTNAGFDSVVYPWSTSSSSASLAVIAGGESGNCLELTRVSGTLQDAYVSITTVIGEHYRVVFWVKSGTSGDEAFYGRVRDINLNVLVTKTGTSSSSWTMFTYDFVAVTTTTLCYVIKNTATAGTMLFDSVSCKLLTGVNNTLSTGRGKAQVRTVVDTAGKAKVEGGKLYLTGDGSFNNKISYPAMTRIQGLVMLIDNSFAGTAAGGPAISLENGSFNETIYYNQPGLGLTIRPIGNSLLAYPLNLSSASISKKSALVSRLNGLFGFVYINNLYTLIYPYYLTNSSIIPTFYQNGIATNTLNSIRIPRQTFLPVPLISDNFTGPDGLVAGRISNGQGHPEANGGAGLVWQGGSGWQISGNTLINNPPLGDELLTDGGLEAWTATNNLTSWSEDGTVTQTNDVHSGISAAMITSSAGELAAINQTPLTTSRVFTLFSVWAKKISGNNFRVQPGGYSLIDFTLTTSWSQFNGIYQFTSSNPAWSFKRTSTSQFILDDISVKQVAFTNLLLLAQLPTPNIIMEAKITAPSSQALAAGVALNFDSFSSPQNGTLVWLRNGNVVVQKIVSGTWTDLYDASTGYTYSPGAKMIVISDNVAGEVRVIINNVLITSTTSTQDAGIKNNRYFGLFSGNLDQHIDDVVVWARGTENQYKRLDFLQ